MSGFFRRNVFQATVGGSVTRTRMIKRRHTLYFSDIFTEYIRACEDSGHSGEMRELAREWMLLYFTNLVPGITKMLPLFILNNVMRKIWISTNLMEDFSIKENGGNVEISTEKEAITKAIGENQFSAGLFIGICNALFRSEVDMVRISQTRESCLYIFRLNGKPPEIPASKGRDAYRRLNALPYRKGFTLEYAFRRNILRLTGGSKISFRGRPVNLVENTLFHLIGNRSIMLDTVPGISHRFFSRVTGESSPRERLRLIKTLLQIMGWGSVGIMLKDDAIVLDIRNPPHGIQAGRDNWKFLTRSVLGYLWLLDRGIRIRDTSVSERHLRITYGPYATGHQ